MSNEAILPQTTPSEPRPRVVIIGGGFGGLAVAQQLGGTEIDVTVVDRRKRANRNGRGTRKGTAASAKRREDHVDAPVEPLNPFLARP